MSEPSWWSFDPFMDELKGKEKHAEIRPILADFLTTTIGRMPLNHVMATWIGERLKKAVAVQDGRTINVLNELSNHMHELDGREGLGPS